MTWKGQPLINYETVVNLIGATKTKSGLRVKAVLDTNQYEIGVKVTKSQMDALRIRRHQTHPDWKLHTGPSYVAYASSVCSDYCSGSPYSPKTDPAPIHVVDLQTRRFSALPGSEGMWFPRWSPDGRFIAGLSTSGPRTVLYDFQIRKQSELSSVMSGWPGWSPEGDFLFYRTFGNDASWWRVRMRDWKTERIPIPKNIRVTGWFAPAPNNTLITARSVGTDEIYALDWEAP